MNDSPAMQFTGERFTPECVREIWYEHWHRYVFASRLAHGKRVLDAACGEGYGSAILADAATNVVGMDISEQAVDHAKSRYGQRTNLRFERGDCTQLNMPPESFDLIVSFETLEHVHGQESLVAGFAHALASDGILMISSPDKKTYSDARGFSNEFHVRELYREELLALLRPHFPFVRLYGQKLLFQSAIWSLETDPKAVDVATSSGEAHTPNSGFDYEPLYFLAVCSRRPFPDALSDIGLFGDKEESVYSHYNGEVRKNMAAGKRIAELEQEVRELKANIGRQIDPISAPTTRPWWQRIFGARGA